MTSHPGNFHVNPVVALSVYALVFRVPVAYGNWTRGGLLAMGRERKEVLIIILFLVTSGYQFAK